jgi:RNA polymerase sigma-70 factor (ECF subfamily)
LSLYDPTRRFSTWLFTLAKHLAVSHARKRSSSEETQAPVAWDSSDATNDPAIAAEQREEGIQLWRLASQVLKVEQRSALWLRYAEDLSIDEIAHILDKRSVSVRVLLHRAREALAQHLSPLSQNRRNQRTPKACLVQNTGGRP